VGTPKRHRHRAPASAASQALVQGSRCGQPQKSQIADLIEEIERTGEQTMDFVAIDVETANADMASICQIAVARCTHGAISHEWKSYVDPADYFDFVNISIHGIDESMVEGAPTFSEVCDTLHSHLQGRTVVCHTHFDRVAIQQACRLHGTV